MHYKIVSAFVVYFAFLLLIGLSVHRRSKTASDFIIGNRSLSYWLTAISAQASDMSAWLFIAFPMIIFNEGLQGMLIAFGLLIGMFLNWHFVAPALRVQTEKTNCYTLSTFFERRFGDTTGALRLVSAIMLIVFLTFYLGGSLMAVGRLFESIFSIDYHVGITVAVLVMAAYTIVGGFITVAWTDFFQGIFLLVSITVVPIAAFLYMDGFTAFQQIAEEKAISLSFVPAPAWNSWFTNISIALGWGLGYFGMPHVITKFMGIQDPGELKKSKYLGISWQALALAAAACVGIMAVEYFPEGLDNAELIFIEMVKQLFNPFIGGMILCGITAAYLSTMDSQILVCASIITEDIYKRIQRKEEATSKQLLKVSRLSVLGIGIFAWLLAVKNQTSILDAVYYAWSGLASAFGPIVIATLFSKKANKFGALAGILVGGIFAVLWPHLNPLISSHNIMVLLPAFPLGFATIYIVSAMTGGRKQQPIILKQLSSERIQPLLREGVPLEKAG